MNNKIIICTDTGETIIDVETGSGTTLEEALENAERGPLINLTNDHYTIIYIVLFMALVIAIIKLFKKE